MPTLKAKDPGTGQWIPLVGGPGAGYWKSWVGTQAEYDALGTYDPEVLYIVVAG